MMVTYQLSKIKIKILQIFIMKLDVIIWIPKA